MTHVGRNEGFIACFIFHVHVHSRSLCACWAGLARAKCASAHNAKSVTISSLRDPQMPDISWIPVPMYVNKQATFQMHAVPVDDVDVSLRMRLISIRLRALIMGLWTSIITTSYVIYMWTPVLWIFDILCYSSYQKHNTLLLVFIYCAQRRNTVICLFNN